MKIRTPKWASNINGYSLKHVQVPKWFVMLSLQIDINVHGLRHVQVSKTVCDVICLKEC